LSSGAYAPALTGCALSCQVVREGGVAATPVVPVLDPLADLSTRHGFRMLLEMECADIIQPDVGWCGGITELVKISALADAHGALLVPHGSSVYSYHFVITRHNSPFAEFLMMAPDADEVVPMFTPLLLNEPLPVNGRMKLPDTPGFGVELNPECQLERPYTH